MTEEEYQKKLDEIDKEARKRKYILARDYALSKAICKAGDFIIDRDGATALVLEVRLESYYSTYNPECSYKVHYLTKKHTLSKKNDAILYLHDGLIKEILPEGSITIKE